MARKKKTIEIQKMLDYANTQLARTDEYVTDNFKAGITVMIERMLLDTNNYNGFRFLDSDNTDIDGGKYYSRYYY